MSAILGIAVTVLLLVLNALFVGSEFALISARRTQIEPRAQAGSTPARMTLAAMDNLSLVMAAAQLGVTTCSLGLGAVSEPVIAHLIEPLLDRADVSAQLLHPIAFVFAIGLVVFLHVVFGEMVPKNLALVGPERAALFLGPFMLVMVKIFKPIVVVLNALANGAVRLTGIEPRDEAVSAYSHDEVAGLVEESRREGLIDDDEYGLLSGALDFYGGTTVDVLLPREDLITVTPVMTPADVEELCADTGFSRFPVENDFGELVGYVHIKDLLTTDRAKRERPVGEKWVHQLITLTGETGLFDALRTMQNRGAHIARVVHTPTDDPAAANLLGVVMLEDVLEKIVGEVHDLGD